MSVITISSIVVSLCALFSYINYKFLKLPATIGIMLLALLTSLILLLLPGFGVAIHEHALTVLSSIDFSETLLHGMLSFLLFAGALHVNLEDLGKQKWIVSILAGFGTMFSTVVVACISYYIFNALGFTISFIYALIFGALISPTDPIAVMAILRKACVAKSLETKVVGESLFNDGIAVVLFLVLTGFALGNDMSGYEVVGLFFQEAIGGALLGFVIGYIIYRLLCSIDHYAVEILLTLALVMGGYELAHTLHVSGPIAMVVAGLLIGNHGRKFGMSAHTRKNLDQFWELVDEFLNAVLFLLIGFEILVLSFDGTALLSGLFMIPLLLATRYMSVFIPISLLKFRRSFSKNAVEVLTWGGLRGGISVALVLSLADSAERDFLLMVTYCIILFSIIVQGLTIGKLVEKTQ